MTYPYDPQQPVSGQPYPPYGYYAAPPRTNGLAIASMIVSIVAIAFCAGLPGIVGAIMGHVAKRQVKERGEQGDGFALAGIIIGWISFGIFLLIVVVYAVLIYIGINYGDSSSYDDDYDWD
ncbi:DUF4190 domain-containing protein [Longispora albida]|uniref:DUF4190 domain-containing protein n=1 Tax=Longispora albida TaxID=203523 RepID=UPI0003646164|nr:DUF4190 domain-containing protein [Longispora albida]